MTKGRSPSPSRGVQALRCRSLLLLCSACLLCAAGLASRAPAQKDGGQDAGRAFDPGMSLEETVAWLGRQLTHVTRVRSADGKYVRRVETRLVKAKGCTLSYSITSDFDSGSAVGSADVAASNVSQTRELWTLDLSGLAPETVRVAEVPGVERRVWFGAAEASRNAIKTSVFRNERLSSTHNNRNFGHFYVRDEPALPQAAAALSHAAQLCREKKQ